jgi:hypothetical protein
MKTFRFLLTAAVVLMLMPVWGAQAGAQVFNERGQVPVDEVVTNLCTGEDVHLTGTLMWVNHSVVTSPGVLQWNYQMNYQGVCGEGLVSGIQYRGIGGEKGSGTTVEGEEIPYHYTAGGIYTLHLVAQGIAPDLKIKYHVRVVVTPDFKYTVEIFDYEIVCK